MTTIQVATGDLVRDPSGEIYTIHTIREELVDGDRIIYMKSVETRRSIDVLHAELLRSFELLVPTKFKETQCG